jgi:precorrin-6Y C5,15-methyltransferase (decarboxylating)
VTIEPVTIIGIGPEGAAGLSEELRELIARADELWGGERLLDAWPDVSAHKVALGGCLLETLQGLKKRSPERKVVILASGDPLFYGVAASVLKILPEDEVCVYPQVSSLQAAFARARIPWQNAALTSAHARPICEVIGLARRYPKLGILTDPVQTPAWIAAHLLAAHIPDCRAVVCENLGQADEAITDTRLADLVGKTFSPLNVLLLAQDEGWQPAPAFAPRPDSAYRHRNGLITKRDVRILSLTRLELCETDLVWDVGAGSGAVSVEMAELAWRGRVFAVEQDAECLACLRENVACWGAANVEIVAGQAPRVLVDLPAPTAVFIGGSGGQLLGILAQVEAAARPGCRIVANFTLLENLLVGLDWMQAHGCHPELSEAQFSYGAPAGEGTRLAPSNPVFILSGAFPGRETK